MEYLAYHKSNSKFSKFDISYTKGSCKYGIGFNFSLKKPMENDQTYTYECKVTLNNPLTEERKITNEKWLQFFQEVNLNFYGQEQRLISNKDIETYILISQYFTGDRKLFLNKVKNILKVDGLVKDDVLVSFDPSKIKMIKVLSESLLMETTRQELLNLGRKGAKYKGKNTNRWNAKDKCSVANTVRDYNEIDMNKFWKDDILKFVVKVRGETDIYNVTVEFTKLHQKIQGYVKSAKNLFNRDIVTKALMNALSSSDVKISCSCPDFQYRIAYQATKHGAKAGEQETRASNITNPNDNLGLCCKHILAVLNNAQWIRNVASVIVNYANYCKENLEYNYSRFIFPKIYGVAYNNAVQMCLNDFDNEGNPIDELKTSKELINLANALAKARFKKNKSRAEIEKAQKELEDKEKEEQENASNEN